MRVLKHSLNTIAAIALVTGIAVHAQSWPSQPIRIIVPFPPGGTTDQVARLLQPPLQQALGVSVVIDNRGGASGAIGAGIAARAPPDGYTFLLVFDTHGVNPSLIPNMPFDTLKDLSPIMLLGKSPMVITAHPSFPYKSFAEGSTAPGKCEAGGCLVWNHWLRKPCSSGHGDDHESRQNPDDAYPVQGRRPADHQRNRRPRSGCDRIARAVLPTHPVRQA